MSIRAPARRLLLLGGAPILIAALLIPFTLLPVPSGSIGLTGGRLYEAGWHFKVPFAPARVVPVTGGPVRFDIDRSTPEGATIRIRISLDYRITPAAIEDRADAIGTLGFDRFLGRVTREALEPLPASTLLAPATPAGGTGRARLPRVAIEAIETALRSTGIDLPRLDAWVGPTRAFAPLGSEPVNQPDVADGPMPPIDPTGIRLLLIGLDGADWEIIDPLLRDGRMPHLAALIQNGARGRMRSYDPMISPLLWTTMVTGVGPA